MPGSRTIGISRENPIQSVDRLMTVSRLGPMLHFFFFSASNPRDMVKRCAKVMRLFFPRSFFAFGQ